MNVTYHFTIMVDVNKTITVLSRRQCWKSIVLLTCSVNSHSVSYRTSSRKHQVPMAPSASRFRSLRNVRGLPRVAG